MVTIVNVIEKRALILSVKIQVDKKEKQILVKKANKSKICTRSLNNKKTINLLGKLQFFVVPIMGRYIDAETLYQFLDV